MTDPQDTELELRSDSAEAALMGAVGHHGSSLAGTLAALPGSDFWNPHRGYVWDACRALSETGDPIEPTRIARKLAETGHWNSATQTVVTGEMLHASPAGFAPKHADTISDLARRRELIQAISRARRTVMSHPGDASEVLSAVRAEFDGVSKSEERQHGGSLDWDQLIAEFRTAHSPEEQKTSIPTPWPALDELLGGLFPGRVYVFGGRPGPGKSTAALNIAAHAAINEGKSVLVISKEMPSVDVTGRILARGAEVQLQEINSRKMTDRSKSYVEGYIQAIEANGRTKLAVDARPRRLSGVKALARTHHNRRGLDILVVDYLQLVRTDTPGRNREQEVAQVSMELKALALELDCIVILPAQLNRESTKRTDPRPTMGDLRDSGQIEQDADVVTLLHREKNEKGEPTGNILMIVDKNRHGPTAEITLRWHGGYGEIR